MQSAFYILNMVLLTQPKTTFTWQLHFGEFGIPKVWQCPKKTNYAPNSLGPWNQLNWDNPWHATFWAVCLVAFFGLLRKANLLCKGSTQFNPSKHLRRQDICTAPEMIPTPKWSPTLKWSPNRPRNDPDPEMIPTFLLVDPEMIPKELGNGN